MGYGIYNLSHLELEFGKHSVKLESTPELYRYVRESYSERIEKLIGSGEGKIAINPVEPVNLPRQITNFLEIRFNNKIILEPGVRKTVFLKFPVEVGVFTTGKGDIKLLDVFSNVHQKYSLYGTPINGVVCRYWESEVYTSLPESDPLKEGILKLSIYNDYGEWVEVGKAVFDVYKMKIFYGDGLVYSSGEMVVLSKTTAETRFFMEPLRSGMKKSLEVFTSRKVPMVTKKFFMEWGI